MNAENDIKIKICGLRNTENIAHIAMLNPDYMGFIFYDKSPRDATHYLSVQAYNALNKNIMKTAVLVNAPLENIYVLLEKYHFDALQLHGDEPPQHLEILKKKYPLLVLIKAFAVSQNFDFNTLKAYKNLANYLLFDTKSTLPGGSGKKFDWKMLTKPDIETPFFISGGIGIDDHKDIMALKKVQPLLYAADVNSRFETSPGIKNIELLQKFIKKFKP